jgi:excisionase family DNA binding protein
VTTRPDAVAVALVEQLASLDDDTLRPLAERFESVLDRRLPEVKTDGWMTTTEAARYLDLSVHAIHRLSAERAIPCSQDRPGARLYFKRAELDRWRASRAR